jgi:hypothetical protein
MFTLKYKLPLEVMLNRPIIKDGHKTYCVLMSELNFQDISSDDIKRIDGNYDWIDAWRNRDYDKKMGGFNNKDVLMEVVYDKGNYIITLVSDKSFDTIVKNNRYYSSDGPWEDVTLKEAIERFFEGCIYDGIGENEIGHIRYQGQDCNVWMGNLIEI